MDQPPNNDSKTSRTKRLPAVQWTEGCAPSAEGHADPGQPPGSLPVPTGLVRLREGTIAGASDEALTVVIAEATCLAKEAQRELERRAAGTRGGVP